MKDDLEDALMKHIWPIAKDWIIFLNEPDLTVRARKRVQTLLGQAQRAYDKLTPASRVDAAQTLVLAGYSDRVPAEFWGTDLGQAMFKLGGYPYSVVPTQDVRYLLGVSRQAIGQMRIRGVLVSTLSMEFIGQYTYESVALRWTSSRFQHTISGSPD